MKALGFRLGLAFAMLPAVLRPAASQGVSTVLIPKLQQTAQVLAAGEGAAETGGLNALGVNPAALALTRPEALFQFQQLPLDTHVAMLGAGFPLRLFGVPHSFAATYLELRSSGFEGRDDTGGKTGSFGIQDRLFGLHAAGSLGLLESWEPLEIGFGYKLLSSRIQAYSATAHAFDAGVRVKHADIPLTLGLALRNFGKGPTFIEQESSLPSSILLSGAYRLAHPVTLNLGVKRLLEEKSGEYSLGLEVRPHPMLVLRTHYALAAGSPSGNGVHNLAGGVGFNLFRGLMMDYAFRPFDSALREAGAVGTHRMTLTMPFGPAEGSIARRAPVSRSRAGASLERIVDAPRALAAHETAPGRRPAAVTIRRPWSPGGGESSPELLARRRVQEGFRELRSGRISSARERFEAAQGADPLNRTVRALLPRLELAAAALPESEGTDASLRHARIGAARFVLGDYAGSSRFLAAALRADPERDDVRAFRDEVEGLLRRHPSQADFVSSTLAAARRAALAGRPSEAVDFCEEALAAEPENARAYAILGTAHFLMYDTAKARAAWNRAQGIDPHDPALREALRRYGKD